MRACPSVVDPCLINRLPGVFVSGKRGLRTLASSVLAISSAVCAPGFENQEAGTPGRADPDTSGHAETQAPTGVIALPLSFSPVAKNAMARSSSDMICGRRNQLSAPQMCERRVGSAFGESGCVCDRAHTGADGAPFVSSGLA